MLGDSFIRFLKPEALARLYPRPETIQVERRCARGEQEVHSRDGAVHYVEYVANPLPDGNVLLIARDVSDRRRLDQERTQLNKLLERRVHERTLELQVLNGELERFNYSVSHDLRSPLRNIRGLVSTLCSDFGSIFSGESLNCLQRIESNARRMEALINDFLKLSCSCRIALNTAAVEMRPLVELAVADHLPASEGSAMVIICDMPACWGDPGLLSQVWDNLIGNAFKYSSKVACPRIEIGGAQHEYGLEYWVKDNGAGFDMTEAGKLFNSFERLHLEQEFAGTGIGLATVRNIVERHGGSVSAEGRKGAGATFRFTLPKSGDAMAMIRDYPRSQSHRLETR